MARLSLITTLLFLPLFAAAADLQSIPKFGAPLQATIAALHDPSEPRVEQLVSCCMSAELQALPMEAHQEYFQQLAKEIGSFTVEDVRPAGGGQFYVDLNPKNHPGMRLLAEYDPNPPYGLLGLQVIPRLDMGTLNVSEPGKLDRALSKLAANNVFSGALRIDQGGKTIFEGAYGMADKRFGIANTLQTRFAIGSITKVFTQLATLILDESDKLSLNDTVSQFVPELPPEIGEKITIWQLLRHESGLTDYFGHPEYERRKRALRNMEDYLPILQSMTLAFEPGTASRYSNAAYVLLGLIIQRASGQPYHDFVRKNVFTALGMVDTDFEDITLAGRPYATGYTNFSETGPQGYVRENTDVMPAIGTPAGTSYSTLTDLIRLADGLRSTGVFTEAVLRTFHGLRSASNIDAARKTAWPPRFSAAGGQPGENALIVDDRENGLRVVVLSNYDERLAEDIGLHLYRQLLPETNGQN